MGAGQVDCYGDGAIFAEQSNVTGNLHCSRNLRLRGWMKNAKMV